MKTPFFGADYVARSKNFSDALCINLYPEIAETKPGAKAIGALITAPGLDLQFDVGAGPLRAMRVMAGVLYVVSGNQVYSVTNSYVTTLLGTLPTSSGPCQMIDNGNQLLIVDGNLQQTILNDAVINSAGSGGNNGTYPLPIPAPATGGSQASGIFTISGGVVTYVTITYGGSNYPSNLTILNGALAAVPGVGILVGASITLMVGGGVAAAVTPQYQVASVVALTSGGLTGGSYAPGDSIILSGGNFSAPAVIQVATTQLAQYGTTQTGTTTIISGFSVISFGTLFPRGFQQIKADCTGGTGTGALFTVRSTTGGPATSVLLQNAGRGYLVGDVLNVNTTDGVGVSVKVTSVATATIVSGGSGGTPGPVVISGTTGTGVRFQINGTIDGGGALSALGSIVLVGSYTANPTNLAAEPVSGGGLVGAALSIIMGAGSATIVNAGLYTTKADVLSQTSSSGAGVGATWTPTWIKAPGLSLVPVSLPFPGASTATYQDGFGLINQLGTNTIWQSNLLDLTTWDPLNFNEADADPDNVVAIGDVLREVWVVKEDHAEIWVDAGLNGFAFQRLEGVYIQWGTQAPQSLTRSGDSMFWLGKDKSGYNQVLMSRGYKMEVISTPALQFAIDNYSRVDDAFGFAYQQEGHSFYFLTFPSGNETWVYDINTSQLTGAPMWHRRAAFLNGTLNRHWANCYASFNGLNLVGDYRNGNVYSFNLDTTTDNGSIRKWIRSWRAMSQPQIEPREFNVLQMDMQTGIGVPDGTNPLIVLEWSDDGGHRWSDPRIQPAGKTGEVSWRVKFNRLGSTRYNSGLDRIFRLSSTDPFATVLIGADIET